MQVTWSEAFFKENRKLHNEQLMYVDMAKGIQRLRFVQPCSIQYSRTYF